MHVDQHAQPVAQVELARAARYVGCGVLHAEQRIEARVACLGNDLAVAVGVELVDHDPVVAEHVAKAAHDAIGQRADRRGGAESLHRGAQQFAQMRAGNVDGLGMHVCRAHRLDLRQQRGAAVGTRNSVHRALEVAGFAACLQRAAQRRGLGKIGRLRADLANAGLKVAAELGHGLPEQPIDMHAEQRLHVGARKDDAQIGLAQRE